MIKVFILDNEPLCRALEDTCRSIACREGTELQLTCEYRLPGEGLPKGYDIYSLHATLIRPLNENIIQLKKSNPDAYIIMRNTIEDLSNLPEECRSLANEWCSGWISDSLSLAVKKVIERKSR